MNGQPLNNSLYSRILDARQPSDVMMVCDSEVVTCESLRAFSSFKARSPFAGSNVLIAMAQPIDCGLALIELDGVANRVVICPPGLPIQQIEEIASQAGANIIVCDSVAALAPTSLQGLERVEPKRLGYDRPTEQLHNVVTEWILLTSGTTSTPKLVRHSLSSLTTSIRKPDAAREPIVWASFNDMRRFSGLQMFLHALLSDSTLVLKTVEQSIADFLPVLTATNATHVSGTPTHWRKVLMYDGRTSLNLKQITLVGEIAEQSVLNSLRIAFPKARITHIYGSTESGTGFSVHDGKAGFPATIVGCDLKGLKLKVTDGMLSVKSDRSAVDYIGGGDYSLRDKSGYVETGDLVELRGDRYYFLGRRNGAVNIGGSRVHPEEVEALLNEDPRVGMSAVTSRKNPFTGAILTADIVLSKIGQETSNKENVPAQLRQILLEKLEAYKVPATIRIVDELKMSAAGKLERRAS